MQQPQTRPLLGDSSAVSSTTSPAVRRNSIHNPVTILATHQAQLQQLQQQLQQAAQNTGGNQPLTFALPQPSGTKHEPNSSTAGNHIVYLNQNPINSGTGMGLPPPATPTFGVGINMGLPLSLLNTSRLTSFTSNVITTSNPLLNIGLPNASAAAGGGSVISGNNLATATDYNTLNALNSTLNTNLSTNSISGCNSGNNSSSGATCVTGVVQDINIINSGINRLNHSLNQSSSPAGLSTLNSNLNTSVPTFTNFNSNLNQNFATIVSNSTNSSTLNTSVAAQSPLSQISQINRPVSVLTSGLCNTTPTSSTSTNQPLNILSYSNNLHHHPGSDSERTASTPTTTTFTSDSVQTFTTQQASSTISNAVQPNQVCSPTSPFSIPLKSPASNITAPPTPSPSPNRFLLQSPSNSIQANNNTRHSPSPVASISNTNFGMQIQQSPIYQSSSPMNIGQIASPVTSPYTPAKSPHPLNTSTASMSLNNTITGNNNNRSPAPGGPGPPAVTVRPNTPTIPIQQGMQVLQIIGAPQAYHQQAPSQLVTTRTHHHNNHIFGNQQIQITTAAKPPAKQPPQILPKPPANQAGVTPPQKQRVTTTITTNQPTQPQFVLATASPQQNHPTATATVIPTAQGLFLNQVLPSTGPVIVQPQPGGLQLILRTPTNAQQQTHTAQLTTQQQLIRVVTAQGMQLQGIAPTFFAVPNGTSFPSPVPSSITVTRHTPTTTTTTRTISPGVPANPANNNQIVIQNAMMQSPQSQINSQIRSSPSPLSSSVCQSLSTSGTPLSSSNNMTVNHVISVPQQQQSQQQQQTTIIDQNLLPPPKKKAKKKKKVKKKDDEPPKMDLASIMKISGIGDDDDMFDTDMMSTEMDTSSRQAQTEPVNQITHQLSTPQAVSAAPTSTSLITPPTASSVLSSSSLSPSSTSSSSSLSSSASNVIQNPVTLENIGSQLVAQLQVPVQNTISGHLRLAVSEDGKVILHHTPEPNQPEIDQATAQALIRSLTQGIQIAVGATSPKPGQPPVQNDQTGKIITQPSNVAGQQQAPNPPIKKSTVVVQNTPNINVRQNVKSSQPVQQQQQQTQSQHQVQPAQQQQQQQQRQFHQVAGQTGVNRPASVRTVQQKNQADHGLQQQINEQINQQNIQQLSSHSLQSLNVSQQPDQRLDQNFHKITVSNVPSVHNSFNLMQNTPNNTQLPSTVQLVQTNDNSIHQQQAINILAPEQGVIVEATQRSQQQQQELIKKETIQQQTQQQSVAAINLPGQQYYSFQKATLGNISSPANSLQYDAQKGSVVISSQPGVQQLQLQLPQQQQQQPQNIIFSNDPCIRNVTTMTNEPQQKQDVHQNSDILNPAPANALNTAPKITPEILSALSNLNPNDQLLIANANGQMQVISQQFLQQLLTGQLNSPTRQNQTQKIVIGNGGNSNATTNSGIISSSADTTSTNSQGLHGIQINAPTGQIIVNSSGGAPTIQNNIQNIVVQAAPSSQLHHSFPIHSSSFPSQFIDNLNQQQIRSLSTNNQPVAQQVPSAKKTKVVKRTKVVVTTAQNIGYVHGAKSTEISVNHPGPTTTAISTAKTTTTTTLMTPITSTSLKADKAISNQSPLGTNEKSDDRIIDSSKTIIQQLPSASSPLSSLTSSSSIASRSCNQQVVQKQRRYIQLPLEKQQMLKNIQTRIQAILERKTFNTQKDQAALTILCQEHNKIVASGKVINPPPGMDLAVSTAATISTSMPEIKLPLKSAAGTATSTTTTTCNISKLTKNQMPVSTVQRIGSQCISNEKISDSTINSQSNSNLQYILNQNKQQKFYQVHENRPSALNIQNFSSNVHVPPMHSSNVKPDHSNITQQSIQCQTDELDIKPNIESISTVKQELLSPIQVPITSPVNQVTSPISADSSINANAKNTRLEGLMSTNLGPITSTVTSTTSSPLLPLTTATSTTSPITSTLATTPKQGVKRPATSPIFRQVNRIDLFEKQLKIDQNDVINPDVNTPFSSKKNACKRLLKYHCFNEQVLSIKDLAKADEIFEETAKHLLGKFHSMMNKYTYLLLMESMREVRTSELMMIDRAFVAEEQNMLNRLREQEAKANEELKKEEKPLFPKVEVEMMDDMKNLSGTEATVASSLLLSSSSSSSSSSSTSSTSSLLSNIIVKKELEDDFTSIDRADSKLNIKPSNCISGDYDEWLEIQKELGVYPTSRDSSSKCTRSFNCTADSDASVGIGGGGGGGHKTSGNIGIIGTISRASKMLERTRVNGQYRSGANPINSSGGNNSSSSANSTSSNNNNNINSNNNNNNNNHNISNINNNDNNSSSNSSNDNGAVASVSTVKNIYDTDSIIKSETLEKTWCSATDLERDLLEDDDSLDELAALHSAQIQQQQQGVVFGEHDDITAQVQSAIDSILNLKKRPSNPPGNNSNNNGNNASSSNSGRGNQPQHGDSKDSVLDQAVRSILGS